ncbi:response regulator transcription factor [Exilibacterium tricleocarpae]|uniref:Response regulator transcription factor n=1 Tax=Exilibacterium tricleocarpae TaxID=2591008 RepID=A0A545U9Z4_9GAMM|nr:response regulator [Exilibacterium tricleocarpae]TQV86249.1 response regulator transcription factor [Exilibacterium tricleocarpae]
MNEKIAVIDDNYSICKALARLLNGHGYNVEIYTSAPEFLLHARDTELGCVILDINMPNMSGLQLQEILIDRKYDYPIVFISGCGDIPSSVTAIKKGAVNFLQKPVVEQDLLQSICEAIALHRKHQDQKRDYLLTEQAVETLTAREMEIFRYIITGKLNKQIAYYLRITEKTVKVHRARVKQKLHVKSIVDLVRIADKVGIKPISLAES